VIAYRILRWLLRLAMRVFFRQIEVVGLEHVAGSGPIIFAGNHPNSLIDPILIITTCGRVVHFAAKDTLFSTRIMRALLRGLGAVPLARRTDHGGGPVDNDAAFTAMFDTLIAGRTIGIFPEGLSHDASQLARFKTGTARLALGAAQRGAPVVIVPCGLTFVSPRRFRSRALVQYGAPITLRPDHDPRTLTDEIELTLRGLTVNAADWETVRVLDAVRRLYTPRDVDLDERVELARRFNAHYPEFRDDARVKQVVERTRAYQGRLDELGLSDRELARGVDAWTAARRVGRYLALVLVWLPLMLPGAPLHLPAVALARLAGKKLTPRKDVIATTKVLAGMAIVLTSYAVATAVLGWRWGWPWALAAALVLPLSGYATLRFLDGLQLLRRGLGAFVRALHLAREAVTLRHERDALSADIIRVVGEIRPAGLELMFPPEAR
jgi:glycerol-3-phosphate O-acyltransferase/dihydroxyacetone phosphate acyltransferase